eukprot:1520634-Rhodomonas_salina.1
MVGSRPSAQPLPSVLHLVRSCISLSYPRVSCFRPTASVLLAFSRGGCGLGCVKPLRLLLILLLPLCLLLLTQLSADTRLLTSQRTHSHGPVERRSGSDGAPWTVQFGIIRQLVSLAEADDLQAEPDLPGVRPTAHKPAICPDASLSAVALMLWHLTCERAKVAVQQQRVHRVSDTVCRVGDAGPMASGQVHVGVGMRAGCGTQRRQHSMHSRCQR